MDKNSRVTLQQVETVLMDANSTQVKLNELRAYREQPAKPASLQSVNALRAATIIQNMEPIESDSLPIKAEVKADNLDPKVEAALTFSQGVSEEADIVTATQVLEGASGQGSATVQSAVSPTAADPEQPDAVPASEPPAASPAVDPVVNTPKTGVKAESGVSSIVKKHKVLIILVVILAIAYIACK